MACYYKMCLFSMMNFISCDSISHLWTKLISICVYMCAESCQIHIITQFHKPCGALSLQQLYYYWQLRWIKSSHLINWFSGLQTWLGKMYEMEFKSAQAINNVQDSVVFLTGHINNSGLHQWNDSTVVVPDRHASQWFSLQAWWPTSVITKDEISLLIDWQKKSSQLYWLSVSCLRYSQTFASSSFSIWGFTALLCLNIARHLFGLLIRHITLGSG